MRVSSQIVGEGQQSALGKRLLPDCQPRGLVLPGITWCHWLESFPRVEKDLLALQVRLLGSLCFFRPYPHFPKITDSCFVIRYESSLELLSVQSPSRSARCAFRIIVIALVHHLHQAVYKRVVRIGETHEHGIG